MIETDYQPECPQCGCRDLTVEVDASFPDDQLMQYTCGHCEHQFLDVDAGGEPRSGSLIEVIYNVTRCPWCNSTDTVVTQGPKGASRTRYHQCRQCREPFRSREVG